MGRLLFADFVAYILQAAGDVDFAALRQVADIIDGRTEGVVGREHVQRLARDVEVIHAEGHVETYVGL